MEYFTEAELDGFLSRAHIARIKVLLLEYTGSKYLQYE